MTRPPVDLIAPVITVGGAELGTAVLDAVNHLRISLGMRLPNRARIRFIDDGFAISAAEIFKVRSEITIATNKKVALFTGEVTGVELDVERGAPHLTVIADDPTFRMTLGNKARTFTNVTYSDVLSNVMSEYGLKCNVTPTSSTQKYLLQADSDFGYISEICDRIGYDWWVDPDGTVQFHPMSEKDSSPVPLAWGLGLLQFSVRASALHPQKVTATGWDVSAKQSIESVSNPAKATADASLVTPFIVASSLSSNTEVTTGFRMFSAQGDGTALASSAANLAAASAVTAEGECYVNPNIRVGKSVQVTDVGPASGTYAVTEVEHTYTDRGFNTRFVAGDRVPTGLVDTLATPVVSSFRHDALVIGIVTSLGDSQSEKGYIKVKIPSLGGNVDSAWARVVSMGAGKSRGMTFLPEINDEVIVGFEGGDITRPLVLGGLYSSQSAALDYGSENGSVDRRQIVSRLGHVIELGDGNAPDKQRIALSLAGNAGSVEINKQNGLTAKVPAGKEVSVSAGDTKFEIDSSGNITMSGQKITIKAAQDVEISGLNIKLKANMAAEISAAQAKIAANGMAEVSSGGATSIKGAIVKIN